MNALQIFLGAFWPPLIITTPVLALLALGRRLSLDGNAAPVTIKSFTELAAFPKEDQETLLHRADKKAFSGWRLMLPVVMYAATFSGALAAAQTLPKLAQFPDSFWVSLSFAISFMILAGW